MSIETWDVLRSLLTTNVLIATVFFIYAHANHWPMLYKKQFPLPHGMINGAIYFVWMYLSAASTSVGQWYLITGIKDSQLSWVYPIGITLALVTIVKYHTFWSMFMRITTFLQISSLILWAVYAAMIGFYGVQGSSDRDVPVNLVPLFFIPTLLLELYNAMVSLYIWAYFRPHEHSIINDFALLWESVYMPPVSPHHHHTKHSHKK